MAGANPAMIIRIAASLDALKRDLNEGKLAIQSTAATMSKVDNASATATASAVNWKSALLGAATAFGIAFSAQALIGFVGRTLDAASRVDDLSKKLSVSAESVQRWEQAISLSGGTIADIDTALSFMNKTLGVGDKSTVAALAQAGLKFSEIRAMKPEDAFNAITAAVGKIEDPMLQAAIHAELFGRGAGNLLTALKDGFDEAARAATVLSNATNKELADAEDAWTELGNRVTIVTGTMIAQAMAYLNVWKRMKEDSPITLGDVAAPKAPKAPSASTGGLLMPEVDFEAVSAGYDKIRMKLDEASKAAAAYALAFRAGVDEMKGTTTIKAAEEALKRLTQAAAEGVPISKMTEGQQKAINASMASAIELYRAHGQVAPQSMRDTWLATLPLVPLTHDYARGLVEAGKAYIPLIDSQAKDAASLKQLSGAISLSQTQYAQTAPLIGTVVKATDDWATSLDALEGAFRQFGGSGGGSMGAIGNLVSTFRSVSAEAKTSGQSFGAFGDSWSKAQGGMAKAAVGVSAGMSVVSGAMSVWSESSKAATKSQGALTGAMGGAKAGAMFGPYGMAVGAAAGAILGFVRAMSAGRRAVIDFAASFGGFDGLREKMNVLGDEGERLWIKLTQQTKKGDKAGAQAVMEEINAALAKQAELQVDVIAVTEESALATIETATQATLALDALGPKLITNAEQWAAWSKDVTSHVQALADSLNGLSVPTPTGTPDATPGYATGTHGRYVDFGPGGTNVRLHNRERVMTEAEGRKGGDEGGYVPITIMMPSGEVLARELVKVVKQHRLG